MERYYWDFGVLPVYAQRIQDTRDVCLIYDRKAPGQKEPFKGDEIGHVHTADLAQFIVDSLNSRA